jgi:hypothetical protein
MTTHFCLFNSFANSINRPGGTGRITKIHYTTQDRTGSAPAPVVTGLDVKYTIYSGHDYNLDPDLVQPHKDLESRERRRAAIIKPISDSENYKPNVHHRVLKGTKAIAPKKHGQIGAKKGSASKAKLSLSRRIGFPGVRKNVHKVGRPVASPILSSKQSSPKSNIPREIVFNTATGTNTPNSDCSKSATGLDKYSPLGDEGVENQFVTTASYEQMVKLQRPSVGTSNAECPTAGNYGLNALHSNDDMDFKTLQLQISPRSEGNKELRESFISATPLATGRFRKESHFAFQDTKQSLVRLENCNNYMGGQSLENHEVECNASRANATLRDVYDHEVKKAARFIDGVVQGHIKVNLHDESNDEISNGNARLNKFRTLLNDFLFDSDGMIEVQNLAYNLSKFAKSSSDGTGDYSDRDVETFLTELCAQNKIMQTEGWIYNI